MAAMTRRKLGARLLEWHHSQSDPVYAVGSFYVDGRVYPDADVIEDAIANLEHDLSYSTCMLAGDIIMVMRMGRMVSLRRFAGYTDDALRGRIAELEELIAALEEQATEDHPC